MLKYFLEMDTAAQIMTIIFAVVGVIGFFSLAWGMSIGCVALGYGPEVCGI